MGEFVGVDPLSLRELTDRLQRLHTLLAEHGPMMRQKMQKWDSGLDFTVLPRLIDEALNDARDMQARTLRAFELAEEKGAGSSRGGQGGAVIPFGRAPSPAVRLDWTATGHGGHQARRDAQTSAEALAAPDADPDQARRRMSPLPESLTRHLNDTSYLAIFWAEACPLALRAARALANRAGGRLFSAESTGILRALGASLAASTQMRRGTGRERRPLMSEETRAAIVGTEDPWSAAMLVKYGPDGKSWDSHFLADVTRSMLEARAAGSIDIPLPSGMAEDAAGTLRAEFDPVAALLDRAGENGQAARHVLGDQASGSRYAAMLVQDTWHTAAPPQDRAVAERPDAQPGRAGADLSHHAGQFLVAAVSAGRGVTEDAEESAWSVVRIAKAASEFTLLRPGSALPGGIRAALAFTADRYLADLAAAAPRYGNEARLRAGDPPGPWTPYVDRADLTRFLRHAFPGPGDLAAVLARMDALRRGSLGQDGGAAPA